MYHAITDLFQFDSIEGSRNEFVCFLIGLARSWDDDAECNPAGVVKTLINDASSLVKTEEELHIAQTALSRIRNERNQAMTDVKKLTDTSDRLRKDRNRLKAALEDIVNSGGTALTKAQFEGLQEEVALLKDEKAGLVKVIEHDKAALRAAEDENTAMTLQISLMNEDIDDKNALIEEVQAAASGMMKEYGKLEILHTTAKHELESAKSVITTMKVQQEAEQKVYESRIQRLKARDVGEPAQSGTPAEDSNLRKELAVAKERIAFLEKAYKQKSDALKAAEAATQKPKAQQAPSKTTSRGPDLPKWGFEPPMTSPSPSLIGTTATRTQITSLRWSQPPSPPFRISRSPAPSCLPSPPCLRPGPHRSLPRRPRANALPGHLGRRPLRPREPPCPPPIRPRSSPSRPPPRARPRIAYHGPDRGRRGIFLGRIRILCRSGSQREEGHLAYERDQQVDREQTRRSRHTRHRAAPAHSPLRRYQDVVQIVGLPPD